MRQTQRDIKNMNILYAGLKDLETMEDYVNLSYKISRGELSDMFSDPLTKDIKAYLQRILYKYATFLPLTAAKNSDDSSKYSDLKGMSKKYYRSVFNIYDMTGNNIIAKANEELTPQKLDEIHKAGQDINEIDVYKAGFDKNTKVDKKYVDDVLNQISLYKSKLNESTTFKSTNMTQSQKVDDLIRRILKEELDNSAKEKGLKEEEVELITPTGTAAGATSDQRKAVSKYKPGTSITYKKAGTLGPVKETSEPTDEPTQQPKASDIAGQVAETLDKLKAMSEATEDRKVQNLTGRAMKQLEAVKTTLESLTAHEAALLEKENEYSLKEAGKRRKTIEKHLRKRVKMDGVVEKMMSKLPDAKIAEMMKKAKDGNLDEEKVAEAMVKLSLKEGVDLGGVNTNPINELSPSTFKSAINVSKERGTDQRTFKLGQAYFHEFIGTTLLGGKIVDIGVRNPSQGSYKHVVISVEAPVAQDAKYKGDTSKKVENIYYDIDKDLYDVDEDKYEIERKDAVVLSKIAKKINPDTKYKETGKHFKIKGW